MQSLGPWKDVTSRWDISKGQSLLRGRAGLATLRVTVPASSLAYFKKPRSRMGRAQLSAGFTPLALELWDWVLSVGSVWRGSHARLCTQRALRLPLGPPCTGSMWDPSRQRDLVVKYHLVTPPGTPERLRVAAGPWWSCVVWRWVDWSTG